MKHMDGPECPSCIEKLKTAHSYLVAWFINQVKPKFPTAHISWAYRGEADQELFFNEGKTHAHYPNSPHNHMVDGEPCSLALDLFSELGGIATWPVRFFVEINNLNTTQGLPIRWGGRFKSLGDGDHFQLMEGVPEANGGEQK